MRLNRLIFTLLGFFTVLIFAAPAAPSVPPEVDRTIQYMLDRVARSDATFIRNGQSYNGAQAAVHLRSKYNYFTREIYTPEDFIRLAGTKSELSGRPYQVQTRSGRLLASAEWLGEILHEYRAARPGAEILPAQASRN